MVLGIAVAHDHGDVLADALGAQGGLGEGGGHGEEVHQAVVTDREDGGHLAAFDIDAADGDVVLLAVVGGQGGLHHVHGAGAVGHDDVGVDAQLFQVGHLLGVADDADDLAVGTDLLHGLIAAQNAGLAVGAQDQDAVALLGELAGLGGSAGHVQSGQGQRLGHILGHLGIDAALKQDGLGIHVHAVNLLVDGLDLVDLQGGQGQGDQRDDLVALFQVDLALQVVADLGHVAHEHAAGAGDGILLLAALGHDAHDHLADLGLVAAAGVGDLGEGGGVNVQGGDIAQNLVGVDLVHVVVDLLSGLGQNTLGFDDAVSSVLVAFLLHDSVPPQKILYGEICGVNKMMKWNGWTAARRRILTWPETGSSGPRRVWRPHGPGALPGQRPWPPARRWRRPCDPALSRYCPQSPRGRCRP